jgi:hypothetical protein
LFIKRLHTTKNTAPGEVEQVLSVPPDGQGGQACEGSVLIFDHFKVSIIDIDDLAQKFVEQLYKITSYWVCTLNGHK